MRGSVRPILRDGQKQYSKRTGESLWRLVYDTGHPGEKRKQRVTSFTGTRKSAEAELRRLIDEFKTQQIDPSNMTVGAMLDSWLKEIMPIYHGDVCKTHISQRTWERYEQVVRTNIKPLLGSVYLQQLTKRDVEKAWKQLLKSGHRLPGKGLSAKSVNDVHGILSNALKWALDEGLVSTVATDGAIKFLKKETSKADSYSTDECAQLLTTFEGHWLQPIVIVAMQTGMRLGEILALHWRHIDFEQKTLTIEGSITSTKERGTFVKDTKTEAGERVIALSDFTCETLRKVRTAQNERNLQIQYRSDDAVVFDSWPLKNAPDQYLQTKDASHAFGRAMSRFLKQKKITRRLRFHDLRHTHLSLLLLNGESVTTVAQRAGHKTAHTTLTTYAHAIAGEQKAMVERMDENYLRAAKSS